MTFIAFVALTYGVSLAIEKVHDTMVTLSKDEETGEIVGNVNYFFS